MNVAGVRNSLQWRISVGLFAVILLTGAVAGGLSFVWALRDANEILDGTLRDIAGLVANGRMAVPDVVAQLPGAEPDDDILVVRLDARGAGPRAGFAEALSRLPDGLQVGEWRGRRWRVLVARTQGGDRVAVAQQSEVRDEIARDSALRTLMPVLLLIPLLVLLVREVVRRSLAPVSSLARHVRTHSMDHAANLPEVDVPLEMQPFVDAIKGLLGELTAALLHQQRFVANAAHELRSPMAALQLQAANVESALQDDEARRRLVQLQGGIARMRHLLEQLLSMARSQAPGSVTLGPVRADETAKEVLAEFVAGAAAKGVDLGMDRCDAGVCVQATPLDLMTMLHNVVENAVKYSPPGSAVTISVYADGGDAVIAVSDGGPGISEAELQRVFEPFYRAPGCGESGTGLGLSIVAAIAQRLGARVVLGRAAGDRGLRFEYRQARRECP